MKDFVADLKAGKQVDQPPIPKLKPAPEVHGADKIPEDLSSYVTFFHPWGHWLLDPFALLVMFFGLLIATILALRAQDIL